MSALHEKIQLEGADVRFLKERFHQKADAKLSLHLPGGALFNDPLRHRVQAMVHEFVDEAFEAAKEGMVIDGREPSAASPLLKYVPAQAANARVEPFDMALNERLRQLYRQVEQETLEVSKMRGEVPQSVGMKYDQLVQAIDDEVERLVGAEHLEPEALGDVVLDEELGGVVEDFEESVMELYKLARTTGAQQDRLRKLDDLCDFLSK